MNAMWSTQHHHWLWGEIKLILVKTFVLTLNLQEIWGIVGQVKRYEQESKDKSSLWDRITDSVVSATDKNTKEKR